MSDSVKHALHTHPFNGPLFRTTRVNQYQKGKTNLDFAEARYSEWQWHQLGHMQVCTSLQTDNQASTPLLSFLLARCLSCHPTNSVKALKAKGKHALLWHYLSDGKGAIQMCLLLLLSEPVACYIRTHIRLSLELLFLLLTVLPFCFKLLACILSHAIINKY